MTEKLERTAFKTSRLLDFMSEKELVFQCGFQPRDWPLVVGKELCDNALDACEEQGIPPQLAVTVNETSITVADNGTGIPPETVEQILDFSIRVSSREAYVAPDRGAQGNALKTIVAMPFVRDGELGRVEICGGGVLNEIEISVDQLRQEPQAGIATSEQPGSFVRVHWPPVRIERSWPSLPTSSLDRDDRRFLQVLDDFTFLNPHLSLQIDWFGEQCTIAATDPSWDKWTPSSPTSPHWYRPADLERLLKAYIVSDRDNGRDGTVREFVSEFRGLSSTVKQKQVLAATGTSREPLSSLLNATQKDLDKEKVAALLASMREHSSPVKPRLLGEIGRAHIEQRFTSLGIVPGSFQYTRKLSKGDDMPQVTEVAFAARKDAGRGRRMVSGVNWSASWANPFLQLGDYGRSLDAELSSKFANYDEPIVLLVHVAHPCVEYADRAKSKVITRG